MQKGFANELIKKAIQREQEAFDLYSKAASMVKQIEVKKIFKDLAEQELGHKKILSNLNLNDLEAIKPSKLSDSNLTAIIEVAKLSENFSIQDALLFSIKREDESYRFYKEFANLAEDSKLKNVFENLAKMEMHHKTSLEDLYE